MQKFAANNGPLFATISPIVLTFSSWLLPGQAAYTLNHRHLSFILPSVVLLAMTKEVREKLSRGLSKHVNNARNEEAFDGLSVIRNSNRRSHHSDKMVS